jgi:HAD superfamily hydrolase (TIGR01490 family)
MTAPRKVAAFFDLDRTLIDINSGYLYALHERRAGRLSRFEMARAMVWLFLYHLSVVDMAKAFEQAVAHFRGELDATLHERTRAWFEAEVVCRLRPGAAAALAEHRDKGHLRVLLTSSSNYVASMALETWGLDGWIANRFPADPDGRLLGTVERPLVYGAGKVVRARQWAAEHGVDLAQSWFYTDSYSDMPTLLEVGHPCVVDPDPRLRRAAKKRGWPILDWNRAG